MHTPLLASLLALSAAGLSAQPLASKYAPAAHKVTLATTFVDWDALPPRTTPVGLSRGVFDNPTPTLEKFEMHITSLRPGMASHPVHHHPWEEMLLIKEGDVEVSINGIKHRAGPGYLIFFASHDPHNLTNVGTTLATYYVINFYTDRVHTVPDKPASEQNVPGMFASAVIDCDGAKPTPTKTGSRVTLIDSPTLTFERLGSHITTLNPGQGSAPDIVDNGDELFIVKQGELGVAVNGIGCLMHAGSFFYCAPNDKRTLRNMGAGPASYQVIKIISAKSPKMPAAAS